MLSGKDARRFANSVSKTGACGVNRLLLVASAFLRGLPLCFRKRIRRLASPDRGPTFLRRVGHCLSRGNAEGAFRLDWRRSQRFLGSMDGRPAFSRGICDGFTTCGAHRALGRNRSGRGNMRSGPFLSQQAAVAFHGASQSVDRSVESIPLRNEQSDNLFA